MSVSFSFTKKSSNKPLIRADDSLEEKKDYVVSVEGKQIQSQNPKPVEKKEYVVPLIKKVNWRVSDHQKYVQAGKATIKEPNKKSEEELALDKEAAAAIKKDLEQARSTDADDDISVVPLLMQNKPPISDDDNEMADLKLRPDESTLDDYDSMPISQFGIACLKGMGWKKSEGIGLTNKRCVEPIEFIQRPAGQGLGAMLKLNEAVTSKRRLKPGEEPKKFSQPIREKNGRVRWVKTLDEEIPQEIKGYTVGAHVTIISGPHNGLLGKIVEGEGSGAVDDEHVNVQLTLNKQVVRFSVKQLKLLSIDEFQQLKEQSMKKSRMQRYGLINMQDEDDKDDDVICVEDTIAPSKPLHKDDPPASHKGMIMVDKGHKHKKKRKHRHIEDNEPSHTYQTHKKHASQLPPPSTAATSVVSWLAPNLRVRCISKEYCKGRYYNQKIHIIDVTGLDSCMCKTDDGRLLEELHQDSLETVVPKEKYANVMVVAGKHKHKLATVLERNSSKAIVTVQLEDSKKVLTLSYDDVCQCTTTVSHLE